MHPVTTSGNTGSGGALHEERLQRGESRAYAPPAIVSIGRVADLLELLGPAQANYGDSGLPL